MQKWEKAPPGGVGEIYNRKRHFKKTGKSKPEAEMKKTCLKEKGYSLIGVFI